MATLQPNEYDISYFDGNKGTYSHNAGYDRYIRWYRYSDDYLPTNQSMGEFFGDLAKKWNLENVLQNKKVLDVGCAYGFLVEDLRKLGVEAYGVDVSQYAYDQASDYVKPYLTVADVRTHLKSYKVNEFDVLISRWFMCCIDNADLPALITDMNRIAKLQVHLIRTQPNPQFYNVKSIQDWLNYGWKKGTILVPNENIQQVYKK